MRTTSVVLRKPPDGITGEGFGEWFWACGRKAAFAPRRRAEARAVELGLKAYRCRYGKHFHLTSRGSA